MITINTNVPLLTLENLLPGDILIEYDQSPDHSMMWLGDNKQKKPLVHSADSATSSGIVAQSAGVLSGDGDEPIIEVYRPNSRQLGTKAAEFAAVFAVFSNDPRYISAKEAALNIKLKTAFSQDRLGGGGGAWNNDARVRAVRAYYRAVTRKPLSRAQGVTCSQFITYTYQAAAIDLLVRVHSLTRVTIQEIIERKLLDNLYIAFQYAAAAASLRNIKDGLDLRLSSALRVDAKITAVDRLTKDLREDDKFAHVGNLPGDD